MLTLSKTSSLARLLILNDCAVLDWLCLSSACIVEVRERVKLRCTHDGHMYGKGDRGQGTTSLFPASFDKIQLSGTGLNTLLWASFVIFWYDFGDSSIFFTPKGTGHNGSLTMLRYQAGVGAHELHIRTSIP